MSLSFPGGSNYFPHFTDEETEAQREVTCSWLPCQEVADGEENMGGMVSKATESSLARVWGGCSLCGCDCPLVEGLGQREGASIFLVWSWVASRSEQG